MWMDERLANAKLDQPLTQTNISKICPDHVVNLSQMKEIWTPGTYIYNLLNEHPLKFTKFNSFMRFYPNGTIYSWSKHLLIISCHMDFTNYPMDKQVKKFLKTGNPHKVTPKCHLIKSPTGVQSTNREQHLRRPLSEVLLAPKNQGTDYPED